MRVGGSVAGHRVAFSVSRPELDAAAGPATGGSHDSAAADVPDATALAPDLTAGAQLVRPAV